MKFSNNIVIDVIKYGELMCDTVYLNPFANFKQWYTPYEKTKGKIVRLNTVIFTKVKLKSINDANINARASNNWRGDTIRLDDVYVFDDTHNEIIETISSWEELHYDELIPEGEVESSDDESECSKNNFSI